MKLTFGMAVYDDFEGVWMTVQALRLYHDCRNIELIVVDNNPKSQSGTKTKDFIEKWVLASNPSKLAGVKYVPFSEPIGTSQPRNEVFNQATGDVVVCVDAHVILPIGTLDRLMFWYEQNPKCIDLLSGPMLLNDLSGFHTHFADNWRGQMWGTWDTDERGKEIHGEPFEIPGMGLGLFTCRKEAWLGFNPHFRGFGGEEMYIHEKYRQAGRRNLCLPFLRWVHRFGRTGNVPYPLSLWNKVRNYVIGHQEIGFSLDRMYEYFVKGKPTKYMSQYQWDFLVEHPIEHINPPVGHGPGTEYKAMLSQCGINPTPGCDCNTRTNQMDIWGPEICREKKPEILGWMKEGEARWGWKDKLQAVAKATETGLAAELVRRYGVFNPLNPHDVLIDEAIRRTEVKEAQISSGKKQGQV